MNESLKSLPSVDQVLRTLNGFALPHAVLKHAIRIELDERRSQMKAGEQVSKLTVEEAVKNRLRRLTTPSLRPVINATGIILHTNLGRAPLPDFDVHEGYSNLEYDLASGRRGKRETHVRKLLEELLGRASIVVNNNAAAVYLVLNEMAAGQEVIVSRGELIEIGDGFRIPEIMARSGAVLREVGTTNRTRISDYAAAINDRTRLILRVHPSNFHMTGFTEQPSLEELSFLGRENKIPVFEDLGSGCVVDLRGQGIREPLVTDSFKAGVNIVCFSGDKLLGGPQSGIIAGDENLVSQIRRNPMYRALRVDKLITQALETTLRHLILEEWSAIPTLRMIAADLSQLKARAERIAAVLQTLLSVKVRESQSAVGGGSTPDQTLSSWAIEISVPHPSRFEQALRNVTLPVIARIEHDRIVLDMRTVSDKEADALITSVLEAKSLC